MKKDTKKRAGLLSVLGRYVSFFLLMAFVITACMLLFLSQLQTAAGTTYTEEELHRAAVLTFGNVVLLSFLCTLIDAVRRRFMVDRPVRQIAAAAERIMQGDFSARIVTRSSLDRADGFNKIIGCFNKMAEELAGIETLRTDFVANVSHELKTPLAVIQNYGTLLQQPELPEEKRMEYARAVSGTCRRLADLITNILKLNKLENQQIFPRREEYDLTEQLCGCLLQFENIWEQKNIDIETELDEGVRIRADQELLALVWNNLLSNAFKFTPEGGSVSLCLKTDGESVTVTVKDSGCGMSAEVGAHIFEKFYQGDPSHAVQGNGLGLALVKRVVDILHGQIQVESAPGRGSVFTVKIQR